MSANHSYWVYMMSNKTRSTLYIGITDNLERRVSQHRAGECNRARKTVERLAAGEEERLDCEEEPTLERSRFGVIQRRGRIEIRSFDSAALCSG